MPNSLKARLKKLKYQGVLSQEDIDRIVILPRSEKVIKNTTMMTNEEALKHLTAKLECLTRSKGFREKCNSYNSYEGCYECDLAYDQGTIEEQKESLKLAIEALKQEHYEDCISRQVVLDVIEREEFKGDAISEIEKLPSVTPQPKTDIRECKNCKHSKDGYMAGTEECHECMWESKQEPKTRHWIEEFNDLEGEVRFTCSSCGKFQLFETDFCCHCGCRMVEGSE